MCSDLSSDADVLHNRSSELGSSARVPDPAEIATNNSVLPSTMTNRRVPLTWALEGGNPHHGLPLAGWNTQSVVALLLCSCKLCPQILHFEHQILPSRSSGKHHGLGLEACQAIAGLLELCRLCLAFCIRTSGWQVAASRLPGELSSMRPARTRHPCMSPIPFDASSKRFTLGHVPQLRRGSTGLAGWAAPVPSVIPWRSNAASTSVIAAMSSTPRATNAGCFAPCPTPSPRGRGCGGPG